MDVQRECLLVVLPGDLGNMVLEYVGEFCLERTWVNLVSATSSGLLIQDIQTCMTADTNQCVFLCVMSQGLVDVWALEGNRKLYTIDAYSTICTNICPLRSQGVVAVFYHPNTVQICRINSTHVESLESPHWIHCMSNSLYSGNIGTTYAYVSTHRLLGLRDLPRGDIILPRAFLTNHRRRLYDIAPQKPGLLALLWQTRYWWSVSVLDVATLTPRFDIPFPSTPKTIPHKWTHVIRLGRTRTGFQWRTPTVALTWEPNMTRCRAREVLPRDLEERETIVGQCRFIATTTEMKLCTLSGDVIRTVPLEAERQWAHTQSLYTLTALADETGVYMWTLRGWEVWK
jgi:hypothetical protein